MSHNGMKVKGDRKTPVAETNSFQENNILEKYMRIGYDRSLMWSGVKDEIK